MSESEFTYWSRVSDSASVAAYRRDESNPLLSAEALPENSSLIDFKSFAKEFPDRLFPLLYNMRPEFQELFVEYYILEKSQSFLADVHGQIQTRIWQNLRIIEQALGALIVLGPAPSREEMFSILGKAKMDYTEYGSLANLISLYAKTQNYAAVAKAVDAPAPAIRKIFRPTIEKLLACRDLKAVAVGCYLRSLTHQASLTGAGLSKRCRARTRRVKNLRFNAPPLDESPLLSFGRIQSLGDTPWNMFEISSEHRMSVIFPVLRKHGDKLFGTKAGQIFAPMDAEGELEFGYIMARSSKPSLTRSLTRVRGISEMAAIYDNDGNVESAVTVPNADVQKLIDSRDVQHATKIKPGDFVEILTGDAARYCGTVMNVTGGVIVEVNFPSGRKFTVRTDVTAVKPVAHAVSIRRAFWGLKV